MYIIKFIRSWWKNRKYIRIINEAIDREHLVSKISTILETQFSRASGARIYAVLNPYIKNGHYSPEQVLEIKEHGGYDDTQWIQQWTMARLTLLKNFITTENLLEVLTFHIDDLGDSNYLFVIEPVTRTDMMNKLKYMIFELLFIGSIAALWLTVSLLY